MVNETEGSASARSINQKKFNDMAEDDINGLADV